MSSKDSRPATVGELMTAHVATIAPDASVPRVVHALEQGRRCVVVGQDTRPVGFIGEKQAVHLLDLQLKGNSVAQLTAGEAMSPMVLTLGSDASAFEALCLLGGEAASELVVVDPAGRLMGLVTSTELLKAHNVVIDAAVNARTRELRRANRELRTQSLVDTLLEVGNRRSMEQTLSSSHALARRHGRPYSVMLVDVDFFKGYNDHYGHLAGDRALQQVTECLRGQLRQSDLAFRYGGDEVLVLLPETPPSGANICAQRAVEAVSSLAIAHEQSPLERVTISIGVASIAADHPTWKDLVGAADRALLDAKSDGRNRAVAADERDRSTPHGQATA